MLQLTIEYPARFQAAAAWEELLRVVNGVVDVLGAKDVAHNCDRAPSSLDAALAERERHTLKARDLVTIVLMDKDRTILRHLATLANCDLTPRKVLTEDERNAAIVAKLRAEAPGYLADLEKRATT